MQDNDNPFVSKENLEEQSKQTTEETEKVEQAGPVVQPEAANEQTTETPEAPAAELATANDQTMFANTAANQSNAKAPAGFLKGIITGLVIGAAITALVLCLIFIPMLNKKEDSKGKTDNQETSKDETNSDKKTEASCDDPNSFKNAADYKAKCKAEDNEFVAKRQDDLGLFVEAVNDYQTNNSGRTPFDDGSVNKNFVKRYIDPDVEWSARASVGNEVSSCGKSFKDPDGKCYQMVVDGMAEDNVVNKSIDMGDFDHTIHVYQKARCGSKEGTYTAGTGRRQIAMFYANEDGTIICQDNN